MITHVVLLQPKVEVTGEELAAVLKSYPDAIANARVSNCGKQQGRRSGKYYG